MAKACNQPCEKLRKKAVEMTSELAKVKAENSVSVKKRREEEAIGCHEAERRK